MAKRVSKHSRAGIGGHYGVARVSQSARRLWIDHRQYPLSAARSPVAVTDLCLAGLRSLPELSGAEQIPQFLAGEARGAAALGHGGACAADQARRDPRRRRRVPAELVVGSQRSDVIKWRLPFPTSDLRHQLKTPTIAPNKHVVSVPERIDFKPSDTTSSRFSGHMVESPAIMMPSEPKLAKPHIA